MNMKNKKGFTLVELLVVIAIIGILSTVAVVNLNSARDKAKAASGLAYGSSLTPTFILCGDETNGLIQAYSALGNVCAPDLPGTDWPTLPNDYDTVLLTDADPTDGTWDIDISGLALHCITCNQTGCVDTKTDADAGDACQ